MFQSLDEVKKAIKGHKEFFMVRCGEFVVVDYGIMSRTTFTKPYTKELRGLTFHEETGVVVSRPMLKFFNVDEAAGISRADFLTMKKEEFEVTPKHDGTMIAISCFQGELIIKTRIDLDGPHSQAVRQFIEQHGSVEELKSWLGNNTAIFEYVSPSNFVVLEQVEEKLILLTLIDTQTGKEYSYSEYKNIEKIISTKTGKSTFDHVVPFTMHPHTVLEMQENIREVEGWVVRDLKTGTRYKVKTDWYTRCQTLLNEFRDRDVALAYLEDKLDDVLPILKNRGTCMDSIDEVIKYINDFIEEAIDESDMFLEEQGEISLKDLADVTKGHRCSAIILSKARGKAFNYKQWYRLKYLNERHDLSYLDRGADHIGHGYDPKSNIHDF